MMELAIVVIIVLALVFLLLSGMGRLPDFVWGFCIVLVLILEHAGAFHSLR
jgi:hypothetical protein